MFVPLFTFFFALKLCICIFHSYSEPQHIVYTKKGYKIKEKNVIHNKNYYLNYYDMKKVETVETYKFLFLKIERNST